MRDLVPCCQNIDGRSFRFGEYFGAEHFGLDRLGRGVVRLDHSGISEELDRFLWPGSGHYNSSLTKSKRVIPSIRDFSQSTPSLISGTSIFRSWYHIRFPHSKPDLPQHTPLCQPRCKVRLSTKGA